MRAHAVNSDDERKYLFDQLNSGGTSPYSKQASAVLNREHSFEEQLNQPPDYKIWQQPTWAKRWEKLRQYRLWVISAGVMLLLVILGVGVNLQLTQQDQQKIITIQITQTAVAFLNQNVAEYPSGSLRILQIEYPTNRPVTFGQASGNTPIIATPAAGSRFAAIQMQFTCKNSLCANPPEANLTLLLKNGQSVSYDPSALPNLIGEIPMERIATGKTTQGWFVFEIPQNSSPEALLVFYGDDTIPPQRISWPNP